MHVRLTNLSLFYRQWEAFFWPGSDLYSGKNVSGICNQGIRGEKIMEREKLSNGLIMETATLN